MRRLLPLPACLLLGSALLLAHGVKPWPVPEKAKKRKNPVAASADSLQQGAALYQSNCLVCHGAAGKGDGPWVEKLPVKPADLTDRRMMREMTDGEIFWKISKGREEMPRFELQLAEEQRWHLVNYLRALGQEKPAAEGQHAH